MKNKLKYLLYAIIVALVILLLANNEMIANSLNRTLIEDNRYIIVLKGLKQTLIISLTSIILGSVLGIIVCYLRMNENKLLSRIGKFVVSLLQGMPVTVLLLIFYYVIFATIDIDPTIVAIITFSIYFSGYTSEIYRGTLESINKGQIDSAYALGFTKRQAFSLIIIPQMFSYIIPVYRNECVSLIKLTSIVGFISIMDLTRASEIIRNKTYEAFFPLLLTALIYYVICLALSKSLDILYKKICPRKDD